MDNETNETIRAILDPYIKKAGGINKAFKYIERLLGYQWTWKYLYHVYRGTAKPSKKLVRKLKSLKERKFRKRKRVHTEALTDKQKENWLQLTGEQRREALDKAYIEN